jgi:hypothetical protein
VHFLSEIKFFFFFFFQVSRNWASHDTPLDTPLPHRMAGNIPRVSAGKIIISFQFSTVGLFVNLLNVVASYAMIL